MSQIPHVAIDLKALRAKEADGRRPMGLSERVLEQGRFIRSLSGAEYVLVPRTWWQQQLAAANAHRDSSTRRPRRGLPGPGTALTWLIKLFTLGFVRPCTGCRSRARRLDRFGWRGLFYGALGVPGFVDRRWERLRD